VHFATNHCWLVNPRVHLDFAERMMAERDRREQISKITGDETGETE
jgi:hypothetical protein